MTTFDRYKPSQWVDEGGLVIAQPREDGIPMRTRKSSWHAVLVIGFAAVTTIAAVALPTDAAAATPIISSATSSDEAPKRRSADPDVIQPGDWERARAYLDALPRLPPPVGDDPPLFDFDLES